MTHIHGIEQIKQDVQTLYIYKKDWLDLDCFLEFTLVIFMEPCRCPAMMKVW